MGFWPIGSIINTVIAWITLEYLNWRWYLGISSLSLSILLVFAFCTLESPKWILTRRNLDETQIVLIKAAKLNRTRLPNGCLRSANRLFTISDEITESSKSSGVVYE